MQYSTEGGTRRAGRCVSGWKEIDVCIFGPVEDPAHMIGHRIFIVGRRDKSRDSGRAQDNSQVDSDHHCETDPAGRSAVSVSRLLELKERPLGTSRMAPLGRGGLSSRHRQPSWAVQEIEKAQ